MRNKIIKQDNEDTERAKTIQSSINRGFHSTTGTLDLPKNVSLNIFDFHLISILTKYQDRFDKQNSLY